MVADKGPYCKNQRLDAQKLADKNTVHPYSPNSDPADKTSEMYWLQFSDFYMWPHVQYFDNTEDLVGYCKLYRNQSNYAA